MEDKLSDLEGTLMDVMMRLTNLSQEVAHLKNKTDQNGQLAQRAKELSDNATQAASDVNKVGCCRFYLVIYAVIMTKTIF